jgi:general L-amino acid transport system permease protein
VAGERSNTADASDEAPADERPHTACVAGERCVTSSSTATASRRPPIWRDVRVLAWAFQIVVVALVVAVVWYLVGNYVDNTDAQGLSRDLTSWLDQPAGFPIPDSEFRPAQPMRDAIVIGLFNTLRLSITGIVLATVLGTLIGIGRLSQNFVIRASTRAYVEFIRNVPLLALVFLAFSAIVLNAFPTPNESWELGPLAVLNVRGTSVFWFEGANWKAVVVVLLALIVMFFVARWRRAVSDRTGAPARSALWAIPIGLAVAVLAWVLLGLGVTTPTREGTRVTGGIRMTPAYFAALLALVAYTSSHIAEIVRASIQAVPRGQAEAADALALSGFQRLWYVVLPQAMRIGVPPIGNQYLNLTKNSSLALVISFPELTKVTQLATASRAPSVAAYTLLLLIYLAISLVISLIVNIVNRRMAIVER